MLRSSELLSAPHRPWLYGQSVEVRESYPNGSLTFEDVVDIKSVEA
jgi:hypothetical protein